MTVLSAQPRLRALDGHPERRRLRGHQRTLQGRSLQGKLPRDEEQVPRTPLQSECTRARTRVCMRVALARGWRQPGARARAVLVQGARAAVAFAPGACMRVSHEGLALRLGLCRGPCTRASFKPGVRCLVRGACSRAALAQGACMRAVYVQAWHLCEGCARTRLL